MPYNLPKKKKRIMPYNHRLASLLNVMTNPANTIKKIFTNYMGENINLMKCTIYLPM